MKYHIRYNIDAFFTAEVEANSLFGVAIKYEGGFNCVN